MKNGQCRMVAGTLGGVQTTGKTMATTSQQSSPDTPAGGVPGAQAHYQAALDQGQFLIQRCEACKQAIFYPRMICPHCAGSDLQWFSPSGRGVVYSTTVVRRKPEAGGDYNVALVDLEEGARLMSRVDGLAPADVSIGLAVQVKVEQQAGHGVVVFHPAQGQQQGASS